jgi:hypothetical protein
VVVALAVLLLQRHQPGKFTPSVPGVTLRGWSRLPEVRLIVLALPLQLLWEIAQFPLYTVWHQNDWSYILYGLAHCTLGDLIILLVLYELIAIIQRDRYWYLHSILPSGILFTIADASAALREFRTTPIPSQIDLPKDLLGRIPSIAVCPQMSENSRTCRSLVVREGQIVAELGSSWGKQLNYRLKGDSRPAPVIQARFLNGNYAAYLRHSHG